MNMDIHNIEKFKVSKVIKHKQKSNGRIFYTVDISIKSEDGNDKLTLYSSDEEDLQMIRE